MPQITFARGPLFQIDYSSYIENKYEEDIEDIDEDIQRQEQAELEEKIAALIERNNMNFSLDADWIVPMTSDNPMEKYITDIKKLLQYLNKKNIEIWRFIKPFTTNKETGFIGLDEDNIIVGYIDKDFELNKKYYPISDNRKI